MLIVFLLLTLNLAGLSLGVSPETEQKALAYLNKYHYLSSSRTNNVDVSKAIKTFQEFFDLKVTGTLNNETIAIMNKPRCGNPDVTEEIGRYSTQNGNAWQKKKLTYFLQEGYNWNIQTQRRLLKEAFNMWARYTQLEFELVSTPETADIKISFGKLRHKGISGKMCPTPFDGWGGDLAHAFFPPDGRLHFDASESFGDGNTILNYDFLEVAAHEIGHILGLGHSYNRQSIMFPTYQGNYPVKLFHDDVNGIRLMYEEPDVEYILGNLGESCDNVCAAVNKRCASTGHNFPPEGALQLFETRDIDCKFEGNEEYEYADNPGYMVSGGWMGQCIGFRNIPNTINCGAGGNMDFRRLCPCKRSWGVRNALLT